MEFIERPNKQGMAVWRLYALSWCIETEIYDRDNDNVGDDNKNDNDDCDDHNNNNVKLWYYYWWYYYYN